MAVSAAAIAKKAAELLASSEKGRKFFGFLIGITIFILLLPAIVLLSLFGSVSTDSGIVVNESQMIASLSPEQQEEWQHQKDVLQVIADTFMQENLTAEIGKAQVIYLSVLVGKEKEDGDFYQKYVACFLNTADDTTVFDNIKSTFGVALSEDDIAHLNELCSQ